MTNSLLLALLTLATLPAGPHSVESIQTKAPCSVVMLKSTISGSLKINCPTFPNIADRLQSISDSNRFSIAETRQLITTVNILLKTIAVNDSRLEKSSTETRQVIRHIEEMLSDFGSKPSMAITANGGSVSVGQTGGFNGNVGTMNVTTTLPDQSQGLPLKDIPHPDAESEAATLLDYLRQLVQATHVSHVRLSAIFYRVYDGMPDGAIDWVEALAELARQRRISNVVMIPASWTYKGIGINENFAVDYEFDIVNVGMPVPIPSAKHT